MIGGIDQKGNFPHRYITPACPRIHAPCRHVSPTVEYFCDANLFHSVTLPVLIFQQGETKLLSIMSILLKKKYKTKSLRRHGLELQANVNNFQVRGECASNVTARGAFSSEVLHPAPTGQEAQEEPVCKYTEPTGQEAQEEQVCL